MAYSNGPLADASNANGLEAMQKRLAGAKTNKKMKPPKKGGKQFGKKP